MKYEENIYSFLHISWYFVLVSVFKVELMANLQEVHKTKRVELFYTNTNKELLNLFLNEKNPVEFNLSIFRTRSKKTVFKALLDCLIFLKLSFMIYILQSNYMRNIYKENEPEPKPE